MIKQLVPALPGTIMVYVWIDDEGAAHLEKKEVHLWALKESYDMIHDEPDQDVVPMVADEFGKLQEGEEDDSMNAEVVGVYLIADMPTWESEEVRDAIGQARHKRDAWAKKHGGG